MCLKLNRKILFYFAYAVYFVALFLGTYISVFRVKYEWTVQILKFVVLIVLIIAAFSDIFIRHDRKQIKTLVCCIITGVLALYINDFNWLFLSYFCYFYYFLVGYCFYSYVLFS